MVYLQMLRNHKMMSDHTMGKIKECDLDKQRHSRIRKDHYLEDLSYRDVQECKHATISCGC